MLAEINRLTSDIVYVKVRRCFQIGISLRYVIKMNFSGSIRYTYRPMVYLVGKLFYALICSFSCVMLPMKFDMSVLNAISV